MAADPGLLARLLPWAWLKAVVAAVAVRGRRGGRVVVGVVGWCAWYATQACLVLAACCLVATVAYALHYRSWVPPPLAASPLRFHTTALPVSELLGTPLVTGQAMRPTPASDGVPSGVGGRVGNGDAVAHVAEAIMRSAAGGGGNRHWSIVTATGQAGGNGGEAWPRDAGRGVVEGLRRLPLPTAMVDLLNRAASQWVPGMFALHPLAHVPATGSRQGGWFTRTPQPPNPHALAPGQQYEAWLTVQLAWMKEEEEMRQDTPGGGMLGWALQALDGGDVSLPITVHIDLLTTLPAPLRRQGRQGVGAAPSPSPPPPTPAKQAGRGDKAGAGCARRGELEVEGEDGVAQTCRAPWEDERQREAVGGDDEGQAEAWTPPPPQPGTGQTDDPVLLDAADAVREQPWVDLGDPSSVTVLARCTHTLIHTQPRHPGNVWSWLWLPAWLRWATSWVAPLWQWATPGVGGLEGGAWLDADAVPGTPTMPHAITSTHHLRCFEGFTESGAHPTRGVRVVLSSPNVHAGGTLTLQRTMVGWQYFLTHWFWTALTLCIATLTTCLVTCTAGACAAGRMAAVGDVGVGLPAPTALVHMATSRDVVGVEYDTAVARADARVGQAWQAWAQAWSSKPGRGSPTPASPLPVDGGETRSVAAVSPVAASTATNITSSPYGAGRERRAGSSATMTSLRLTTALSTSSPALAQSRTSVTEWAASWQD